jgi:DNA-binding response OmpR family regulator
MANSLLDQKKVLIVDDEPDVLETLRELLSMCEVTEAATFERAKELLETQVFDIAILDIMGVDGYQVLQERGRPLCAQGQNGKHCHLPPGYP